MIYFKTRNLARSFAAKKGRKVLDNGKESAKRWSVRVL